MTRRSSTPPRSLSTARDCCTEARTIGDPQKVPFALNEEAMARYGFEKDAQYDLLEVIRRVRPTVLIGHDGPAGHLQ